MAKRRGSVLAVVDDDSRILESLESLLESAGHVVRLFNCAGAFLESDGLAEVDCLISDIGMRITDGHELKRIVQVKRPDLPVILITGREDMPPAKEASAPHYQTFFRKPFSGVDLLAAVDLALRGSG